MDKNKVAQLAKAVIETETRATQKLLDRIDDTFTDAVETMLHCKGRVVVLGMGKSGHIGNKIAQAHPGYQLIVFSLSLRLSTFVMKADSGN